MAFRRLLRQITGDRRGQTISDLRERGIIGVLTTTSNATWDDRLNRTMILPAGVHLWTIDPDAAATAEGQSRLRVRLVLIDEPAPSPDTPLPLPPGTLTLLAEDDEVHTWNLVDLLTRIDAADDQAGEDLFELELHVQQLAMAKAMEGYEVPESMRWPDET
jgi:hypothetical protein